MPRYYVKIDRADGSRTYKGAWQEARAERERQAWLETFEDYRAELVSVDDGREDMKVWTRTVRTGAKYYPAPTLKPIG